jgi:hypothetical protein
MMLVRITIPGASTIKLFAAATKTSSKLVRLSPSSTYTVVSRLLVTLESTSVEYLDALTNIWLGLKEQAVKNALAYYTFAVIIMVKSFIVQA